jgi:hypothetical protein
VPALAIYLAVALLLIGRYALADPAHVCVCLGPNGDPPFFMWALKWWPYAIGHGLNPFFTHAVWYPGGANIATVTGIPGAALALWPVTALLGPLVAYDVAAVLGPVLSALAAYALCRHLTGRWWASLVGGFVYGFSSYELGQLLGHLHITLVFLVPLVPLLVLRRLGELDSGARFVVLLAAVLAGQVLLSTEIAFDAVLLGAFGLAAAFALVPAADRRRLATTAVEIVAAGGLAVLVVSPFLYWALVKGDPGSYGQVAGTHFADRYRLNPLNLVVPTPLTWVLGRSLSGLAHFDGGNLAEAGGYLGLPLVALFGGAAVAGWRRPASRFLLAMAAVAGVLALGPRLSYGSHTVVALPWRLVEDAPVFKAVLPTRFSLFIALIVGVGVALELGRRDRRRPWLAWVAAAIGVVAVLPDPTAPYWHSRPPAVPVVVAAAHRYLPGTGSVLMVPVGQFGSSMYWQAVSDFAFPLANGRVALVLPPEYATERAALDMANGIGPPRRDRLYEFLVRHRVGAVVVAPALTGRWDPELRRLGLRPRVVAGTSVYYVCGVPAAVRACAGR